MPRPRTPAVVIPVDEKVIGERIRDLRKRQGMSQAELATELGVNQTAVSDYETGAARIHAAPCGQFQVHSHPGKGRATSANALDAETGAR